MESLLLDYECLQREELRFGLGDLPKGRGEPELGFRPRWPRLGPLLLDSRLGVPLLYRKEVKTKNAGDLAGGGPPKDRES